MQFFLKRLVLIITLVILCSAAPGYAEDCYLYLGYDDTGKIYRLTTSDQNQCPTGYIFACSPGIDAFFVDQLQNFRFLKCAYREEFVKSTGYLYRQVFDGLAVDADRNVAHSQLDDKRDELVAGMSGRPVFRPEGAPFSAGTGLQVTEGIAMAGLEKGEFVITPGKKWTRIPNDSWYQSWLSASGSLKIFYDCWEELPYSCSETIWRGVVPGIVFERQVASGSIRRLNRTCTDGVMEKIPGCSGLTEILALSGISAFHRPGKFPGEGDLLVHTWAGRNFANLFLNGKPCDWPVLVQSHSAGHRAAGLINTDNGSAILVVGEDNFDLWLQNCGADPEKSEFTMAAFSSDRKNRSLVYVYSRPDSCVYCFGLDQNEPGRIELVQKVGLSFDLQTMQADTHGNLYLGALELVPAGFASTADYITGFESLQTDEDEEDEVEQISEDELHRRQGLKRDRTGRLVFSQTGNAVIYVLEPGQNSPERLGAVFLDKIFLSRECRFSNVSTLDLQVGAAELLALAEKPGNSLAELRGNVPGFPDQYRKPLKMLIAVQSEAGRFKPEF